MDCCVCPCWGKNVHFYSYIASVRDERVEFFGRGGVEVGVGLRGVMGVGLTVGDVEVRTIPGRHCQSSVFDTRILISSKHFQAVLIFCR